ncbi:hypothetical protein J6G99_04820 [bacterium]|nr:hypothetical protein [bacterium]
MKKIFLSILTGIIISFFNNVLAKDIIPNTPTLVNVHTVGLYQVGNDVTIYKFPDDNSQILYRVRWNSDEFFPADIGANNFFSVFVSKKELALINVVDIADGWVEIVYNNSTGATGWIKEDDPYKFMTWINFYNTYGKKYGLNILKGAPAFCKDIKSAPEDTAQNISTINVPKHIHLNLIRGNWALISVMDLDKAPKTGYVRWRSEDGVRYYFPAVK